MTQEAVNNAKVLYRLGVNREEVDTLRELYCITPELMKVMASPVISIHKKDAIIESVYGKAGLSKTLINFTKMMCRLRYVSELPEIMDAFYLYWDKKNHIMRAKLIYADMLNPDDEAEAIKILENKYPDEKIVLTKEKDDNLLGGYAIQVNNKEYDRSYEGRLRQLERKLTGR